MLRPLLHSDSTNYVSLDDPAIDWERSAEKFGALPEYAEWAKEQEKLRKEKLGANATTPRPVEYVIAQTVRRPSVTTELIFKDGEQPTVFVIGAIPPGERARINDECQAKTRGIGDNHALRWRTFLACLRDIKNFSKEQLPKSKVEGVEFVSAEYLRKAFPFSHYNIALEVGYVAYIWNELTNDDAKN